MLSFTSDQWVIVALVFILGLVVGGFLFSGGGRKWKTRYNGEVDRRRELERVHADREKEWREQDSLRAAALKDRARDPVVADRDPIVAPRDPVVGDDIRRNREIDRDRLDERGDAVRTARPAGIVDRVLGRDADHDGIDDRDERPR